MKKIFLLFLIILLGLPLLTAFEYDNPYLPHVPIEEIDLGNYTVNITYQNYVYSNYSNSSGYWDDLDTPMDFKGGNFSDDLIIHNGAFNDPSLKFSSYPKLGIGSNGQYTGVLISNDAISVAWVRNGLIASDSAEGSPSYSFWNDPDTGMFGGTGYLNTLRFTTGGTERLKIDSSGTHLAGGESYILTHPALDEGLVFSDKNNAILEKNTYMWLKHYSGKFIFKDSNAGGTMTIDVRNGLFTSNNFQGATSGTATNFSGWDGGAGTAGTSAHFRGGWSGTAPAYAGGHGGNVFFETGKQTDDTQGKEGDRGYMIWATWTAGNTPTLTERMRMDSDGNINMTGNLNVVGTITSLVHYAQLSDLEDQTFGTANVKQIINLTTTDEIYGLSVQESNVTIATAGVYSIFAQPQVTAGPGDAGDFHMWMEKWDTTKWVNVSNSNVELVLDSNDEDVIPLIVTIKLNTDEKIRVMGSVSDTGIKLDAQILDTEPAIPSIIFTMYRIGS